MTEFVRQYTVPADPPQPGEEWFLQPGNVRRLGRRQGWPPFWPGATGADYAVGVTPPPAAQQPPEQG